MNPLNQIFQRLGPSRDLALSFGVMAIIGMLILPMPAWMLDFGLTLSITVSVLILMTALFIEKPLQLSSFPTILLIVTMLRLGLNLASTRLILSHGHEGPDAAGEVRANARVADRSCCRSRQDRHDLAVRQLGRKADRAGNKHCPAALNDRPGLD